MTREPSTAAITARTAAVLPVHLFGHPAAIDQLTSIAGRHHLALIEDAAQAAGAEHGDRPVGTFGDAACFSFYPTKNMHSVEGGMIVTPDPAVAARLRLLRNQGMSTKYEYETVGTNARLSDVHAAVGRVQLRALARNVAARRANAAQLSSRLVGVIPPAVAPGTTHAFNQYTVRAAHRDHLRDQLAGAGIQAVVYYPTAVHRTRAYDQPIDLPHTERATR